VPGFDVSSWFAFFVPAKTPRPIVDKLQADTAAVLAEPAIKERIQNLGIKVQSSTPEQLAAHLKAEMDKWGPVIKSAGITARE
jgi:tripartite-type tricarboxylate transporter receptor subunit TctC